MNIIIIPDSFKGTLSAVRVADIAQEEIKKNDEHLQRSYSRKLSDTTAKQESVLIKLKADYEQNRDRWVDEIVQRALN